MRRAKIGASPFLDLRAVLGERSDHVTYGVGHDREVFAVARASKEAPYVTGPGGALFPKSKLNQAAAYLIVRVRGADVRAMTITTEQVLSFVQPIGEDVLLADARCGSSPSGPEKNAVIVGWDGEQRSTLTLGDGIEDLNVTRDGEIWTSYFDEGVFGSRIGASGLVGFDATGEIRFEYQAGVAGTDYICDAYATTITDDGAVWIYFYSEFPIVRVHQGKYRVWKFGERGGRALAIHDDHALLIGDYTSPSLARLVHLQPNGVAKEVAEFDVTDPDGQPMHGALAVGRGSDVFFFHERRAYLLTEWWSAA